MDTAERTTEEMIAAELDAREVTIDSVCVDEGNDNAPSRWRVTVKAAGRHAFTVDYSMGAGHRVKLRRPVRGLYSRPAEPKRADVLYCLTMDAQGVVGATFDDWCAEYSYDTDSRSAHACYLACVETRANLERAGLDLDWLGGLFQDY
jgi:hypothetical protein